MCDPLGGSQVLPYLTGLARRGHHISLISFEKPERSKEERAAVERTCRDAGIDWHPLPYHKHPPLLSSMYDVRQMYREAVRLHRGERFDVVHCRSYLSALVGLSILDVLPWWITITIAVREIGITLLRFWVIRYGVIPASRGGKAKTLAQVIAIGLFVLPQNDVLELIAWVIMAVALVLTVVTGIDYVIRAFKLKARAGRAVA